MTQVVLVHDAWLGAWCWDGVVQALAGQGVKARVVELPAHGDDPTPVAEATLPAYVDRVVDAVNSAGGKPVLVGHSMAGIILSSVAEAIPEKVASLIYVAAYLLRAGETITQVAQSAPESLVGPNMVPAADWSTISIKPEALGDVFAADAPAATLAILTARARPEPAAPLNAPVAVTDGRFGVVRRCYIRTVLDRAVPPSLQDRMLAATPCAEVLPMRTSHTPFFSQPTALADGLRRLAGM